MTNEGHLKSQWGTADLKCFASIARRESDAERCQDEMLSVLAHSKCWLQGEIIFQQLAAGGNDLHPLFSTTLESLSHAGAGFADTIEVSLALSSFSLITCKLD